VGFLTVRRPTHLSLPEGKRRGKGEEERAPPPPPETTTPRTYDDPSTALTSPHRTTH
jgi:hypothetical protein